MTPQTLPNPYKTMLLTFQPNRVYGWEREIISILQVVTAPEPTSYAIYGIRAIGKSTLLKYLKHPRGAMNYYAQYVSPEYVSGGLRRVMWVYINFHRLVEEASIFHVMYDHLCDELDIEDMLDHFQPESFEHGSAKNKVARALRLLVQKLDRQYNTRVVFLMDDFDIPLLAKKLSTNDDRLLRTVSYEASLVIATDEPISELMPSLAEDSPLLGILKPEPIGLIRVEAARRLITEPASVNDVTYFPAEVEMLVEIGGRQPFLLTATCEVYYDMRAEIDDLDAQFSDAQQIKEIKTQLMNRLMAQPHIKNVLSLMWSKHEFDHDLMIQMASLSDTVSGSRAARLATRALAYLDRESGSYRLFSELFAHFVRMQTEMILDVVGSHDDHVMAQIMEGLSPIDRAVLEYLVANPNGVCSFDDLLASVWREGDGTKRALEAAVHRLRRAVPAGYAIRNIRGKGYKYEPPTQASVNVESY